MVHLPTGTSDTSAKAKSIILKQLTYNVIQLTFQPAFYVTAYQQYQVPRQLSNLYISDAHILQMNI